MLRTFGIQPFDRLPPSLKLWRTGRVYTLASASVKTSADRMARQVDGQDGGQEAQGIMKQRLYLSTEILDRNGNI